MIIKNKKELLVWGLIGVLTMITFESAQQYFYIVRFELIEPKLISFWELLRGQSIRWVIWSLYAIGLWMYVSSNRIQQFDKREIGRYTLVILTIILLNITTISILNIFTSNSDFTIVSFIERFVFYGFQKSPIYLIAYTVLISVAHYMISSELLEVKLHQLSKLKESNLALYEDLKSRSYADNAKLIQVKTGSRVKMVPIDSVVWIEADDYCVKIHDDIGKSHTVRNSMKVLERELPSTDFIRIHRNAIVNTKKVNEWQFGQEAFAILSNGEKIMVAQSRIKNLKTHFEEPSLTT